jgi:SNF2 family DNA or RNA helicase
MSNPILSKLSIEQDSNGLYTRWGFVFDEVTGKITHRLYKNKPIPINMQDYLSSRKASWFKSVEWNLPVFSEEEKERPMIEQPSSLKRNLMDHQKTSVYEMELLEKTRSRSIGNSELSTTMGVQGDCTGYGKTLSMVALILRDQMPWDTDESYAVHMPVSVGYFNMYNITEKMELLKINPTLVVCKTSIINQWSETFNFAPKLRVFLITRNDHIEKFINSDVDAYDVVLCSDTRYNDLINEVGDVAWKRFIFDEASNVKIPAMKYCYAGFYWFITATYLGLKEVKGAKNHMLAKIFHSFPEDALKMLLIKNSDEYVKASYAKSGNAPLPPMIEKIYMCQKSIVANAVGNVVPQTIVQMLSAGDIQGVIAHYGGKSTDNIVDLVLKDKRKLLAVAEFKVSQHSENKEALDNWINRTEKLKKEIREVEEKYDESLNGDCQICMENMKKPVMCNKCQNIICGKCCVILLSTTKKCPMCREDLKPENLTYLNEREENDELYERDEKKVKLMNKHKTEVTLDILLTRLSLGAKVIISSSYEESFDQISRVLKENDIPFLIINGAPTVVKNKIKKYASGEVNVIFLNGKYTGAGINLEMTTDIILYHKMESYIEKQVIGRKERIGSKNALHLHRLIDEDDDYNKEERQRNDREYSFEKANGKREMEDE